MDVFRIFADMADVPAGATMQTPTPPTAGNPDPIPQLGYCRCAACCCKAGQGHNSPEYLAWEKRQHARE